MKRSYHELNPLIRAKELELLSQEFMDRLVQAPTIEEVANLLRNTVYAPVITEHFEETFETDIDNQQEILLQWLVEIAPEPEIVWVYTMRFTFHNLKVLTKAEFTGEDLDHLFIPDGFYSLETLRSAIRTGVSDQLPESIMTSITEVKEYFEESTILQGIDVIYDRQFLTEQRRLGEELNYPELLAEIVAFIDLTNITTAARGILQNRTKGFMTTVLSSSGSIPKETLLEFMDHDMETYIDFLLTTDYVEIITEALENQQLNFGKLERLKDNYLTEQFKDSQVQAFGPLPLLAFLNAKEVEIKNLRLIIVAKRSGFAEEAIRERMREVYGV